LKATDGDQEPLVFSAVGLPIGATLVSGPAYGQATINWTPAAGDVGKYTILVMVTDIGNGNTAQPLTDQQTFSLVARTSNQSPVWVAAANQTVAEGQSLTVPLQAVDPDG